MIIGISGNMGAGKTTLAHSLAKSLQSSLLSWDDFDEISTHPKDYVNWYKQGQNYREWDYPSLADTLKLLKSNKVIEHPVFKTLLQPNKFIIFDAPLGRLHQQTGPIYRFVLPY